MLDSHAFTLSNVNIDLEREDGGAFAFYSADWTGYQENVSVYGRLADDSYLIECLISTLRS